MSAIGDYVHYHGIRYDRYGTNRNSGSFDNPNSSAYDVIVNQRIAEAAAKGLTQVELDEIAETISTFMEESASNKNDKIDAIENLLVKQFGKELTESLDYATLNSNASTTNKVGKVSTTKGDNGLYLDLEELVKKINRLEKAYLDSDKSIKALNKLKASIAQEVGLSWSKIKSKSPKELSQLAEDNPIQGKKIKEIRNKINEAINTYAKFPNIASLEGTGFEYIIGAALDDTAYDSLEDTMKAIESTNTGADFNYTEQYRADNFSSSVVNSGNSVLSLKYNQRSKVDVRLEWQGKDLRISAKNVAFNNDYKWIHLVSDSPLLYLIQDMDGTFINHYINSISLKKSTKAESVKQKTSNALKRYIFYKALTGDTQNTKIQDTANLFIVNDKTGKYKVRVYDMGYIYKKISEDLSKVSVKVNGNYLQNINLIRQNTWSGSAEERINNLLNALHRMKVNVSFNAGSVLK